MNNVVQVNKLHDDAMEYADEAFLAKKRGEIENAQALFRKAFEYEAEAARLVATTDIEPTRSVLHRSAATLALDCGEIREAEKLVAVALAGDPPDEIADELRDLNEQIYAETRQKGTKGESVTHVGILQFASSVRHNEIKIVDDENHQYKFIVNDDFDEIVRAMWGRKVKASGIRMEHVAVLQDIDEVSE